MPEETTPKKLDPEALKARLEPSHLKPDIEELKKSVEGKSTPDGDEEAKDKKAALDPRSKTPYTFQLSYEDPRDKKWEGQFTTKILNVNEERMSGIMQAQLCGGIAYENLDPYTLEIGFVISHLAFSLTEKPKWWDGLLERPDSFMVAQAVMREVRSYEEWFRKHGTFEKDR